MGTVYFFVLACVIIIKILAAIFHPFLEINISCFMERESNVRLLIPNEMKEDHMKIRRIYPCNKV